MPCMTGALIKAAARSCDDPCDEPYFCLQPLIASMEELVGQFDLEQTGEEVHAYLSVTHNITIQYVDDKHKATEYPP